MNKPTLLFISMGELATHLLEAVARTDLFGTVVVASRDFEKAKKRVNNAVLGAGVEDFFPRIIAEKLDIHSNDFAMRLREIKPDFIWFKILEIFSGFVLLYINRHSCAV